jgi:hypothetical protein
MTDQESKENKSENPNHVPETYSEEEVTLFTTNIEKIKNFDDLEQLLNS